ncbi:secreted glycosyl hydrolase [Ketogulonicigenium robustum]|uniref:Secreted glycosyl hydrolase n=1 Tax=Ketogulonicigenium robustum TaxID=92947 RepID=A0A1W6P188_9RHOB|nr:ThuA domain-containing protein [Ketogulonicigenium robustum]ARO15272.1 secreted glycosyl hydrolase [Ketogulonicigenium robustum]
MTLKSLSKLAIAGTMALGCTLVGQAANAQNGAVCQGLDPACYNDWGGRDPATNGYSVLIYSRVAEGSNPHANTPYGIARLTDLLESADIKVTATSEVTDVQGARQLRAYDAVIFFNTQRDVLDSAAMMALRIYMESGGGFVGIHNAFGTMYNWEWYRGLLGNTQLFDHGPNQPGTVNVITAGDASTRDLQPSFTVTDEFYNIWPDPQMGGNIRVLLASDDSTRERGTQGYNGHPGTYEGLHPVSWCHYYDGGRAFLTVLGHTEEIFDDANFRAHILGGVESAMGRQPFCQGE